MPSWHGTVYRSRSRIRDMNLPLHKIHDVTWSFGRLLVPWFGGRWIAWFKDYGFRCTSVLAIHGKLCPGFHNCTSTGIY